MIIQMKNTMYTFNILQKRLSRRKSKLKAPKERRHWHKGAKYNHIHNGMNPELNTLQCTVVLLITTTDVVLFGIPNTPLLAVCIPNVIVIIIITIQHLSRLLQLYQPSSVSWNQTHTN